jgi:hypothetical protein
LKPLIIVRRLTIERELYFGRFEVIKVIFKSQERSSLLASLLGEFTNKLVVNVYNNVLSQKKRSDFSGSSENHKGSGFCISHLIGKQKMLVTYLGDVQWPAVGHEKV